MSVAQNTCGCNTTTSGSVSAQASGQCSCGCCGPAPTTREQRIAELRSLRVRVDEELALLEDA